MDCVFCDIVAGCREVARVLEDEQTLAFMDQRQGNPGHVLVIPKQHFADIYALPEDAGKAVMGALLRVTRAVRSAFDCPGLNIWQSNGACGGQEVYHVHFHVHPRWPDDQMMKAYQRAPATPPLPELHDLAGRIRGALD